MSWFSFFYLFMLDQLREWLFGWGVWCDLWCCWFRDGSNGVYLSFPPRGFLGRLPEQILGIQVYLNLIKIIYFLRTINLDIMLEMFMWAMFASPGTVPRMGLKWLEYKNILFEIESEVPFGNPVVGVWCDGGVAFQRLFFLSDLKPIPLKFWRARWVGCSYFLGL